MKAETIIPSLPPLPAGIIPQMMNKPPSIRSLWQRLGLGLILGFLVLLALALFGDIRQVIRTAQNFEWRVYPLALGLTLFNYTLRFIKWHYYLHQMGVTNLAWYRSLRLFIAGFPLAVTPGKVGEALKAVWVHQKSGLPVAQGISVVLAERISDGLAVLILSASGVLAYPQYWPAFAIITLILLAGVILSQFRSLILGIFDLISRLRWINRLIPPLRQFYEGAFILFRPQATLIAVMLGGISWLGEGIGFYLILTGLGLPATAQTVGLAIFILAFSTVIGAVSTLPGGLGAAEASITGMLVLLAHIPHAQAAAATLLIRLATLWFGVTLGLITWSVSPDLLGLMTRPSLSPEHE